MVKKYDKHCINLELLIKSYKNLKYKERPKSRGIKAVKDKNEVYSFAIKHYCHFRYERFLCKMLL